jgi:hypothetical protein
LNGKLFPPKGVDLVVPVFVQQCRGLLPDAGHTVSEYRVKAGRPGARCEALSAIKEVERLEVIDRALLSHPEVNHPQVIQKFRIAGIRFTEFVERPRSLLQLSVPYVDEDLKALLQ